MSQPNFASGTVWTGDNPHIMRGINSECIDSAHTTNSVYSVVKNRHCPVGGKSNT